MTQRKKSVQTLRSRVPASSTHGLRVRKFHSLVFNWYAKHGRDLPWRRTRDPYAITLSEIMLQQTQVDRVIPKWEEFLEALPTWKSLAGAKTSDVLRLWKGMGYNRRALALHRLAQEVVNLGGELPKDIASMKLLPGIGPYTANAVAAFAFRDPSAAPVDTNIARILRRVFPKHCVNNRATQELARLISPGDVWTWNHALMDIGALHCTVRGHNWATCPLAPVHGKREREEVATKKRPAVRFLDSDRYFRGRIIDALRNGPSTMKSLRKHPDLSLLSKQRFATLILGVVNDGLVETVNNEVFLVGDNG